MGVMTVTMRRANFLKLVENTCKSATVYYVKSARISSVWIGYVEVTCLETMNNQDVIVEDWKPLPDYYGK